MLLVAVVEALELLRMGAYDGINRGTELSTLGWGRPCARQDLVLGLLKRAPKTAQHRHGNDDIAVFVGHVRAAQYVGIRPHAVRIAGDALCFLCPEIIAIALTP